MINVSYFNDISEIMNFFLLIQPFLWNAIHEKLLMMIMCDLLIIVS
jgi:hypothetical protein